MTSRKQNSMTSEQTVAASNAMPGAVPACEPFPHDSNVRAKQAAKFLGIGLSTFWLYVKQGRIEQPTRYTARVSVWKASSIRAYAENGIPQRKELHNAK